MEQEGPERVARIKKELIYEQGSLYIARIDPCDKAWFKDFAKNFHVYDYGVAFKELIRAYKEEDVKGALLDLQMRVSDLEKKASSEPERKPIRTLSGRIIR